MDNIKNIVSQVMGRMSGGAGGPFADVQSVWAKVAREPHSRVTEFKDGCVVINADSSMRLVRLNLNRESLLRELRKEFPSIVKISFKVGV
jgi:predicted nucleic acid-binding Zn ribbon protein